MTMSSQVLSHAFKEQKRKTPHRTSRELWPINLSYHIEKGSNNNVGPETDII